MKVENIPGKWPVAIGGTFCGLKVVSADAYEKTVTLAWDEQPEEVCHVNLDAIAERLAAYEDAGLTPDEVAALRRENDALLEDLRGDCASCVHRDAGVKSDVCQTCPQPGGAGFGNWEWRGAMEDAE